MRLIFSGSEVPSNRILLENCGVNAFGFSWYRAYKRGFPKTKPFTFDAFSPDSLIFVTPGIVEGDLSEEEIEHLAADYQDFVITHLDRISGFLEFDSSVLGKGWVEQQRAFFLDEAEDQFWPLWNHLEGIPTLHEMADVYPHIAIKHESLVMGNAGTQINALAQQKDVVFHAVECAKPEVLKSINFVTASTQSWNSPMRNGETIMWDGTDLSRYPKKMKEQVIPRLWSAAADYGLDYAKLENLDSQEATKLAVYSFKSLEDHINGNIQPPPLSLVLNNSGTGLLERHDQTATGTPDNKDVDISTSEVSQNHLPTPREVGTRKILPGFGMTEVAIKERNELGAIVDREVPALASTATSMRQCNSCFIKGKCPEYKPDADCAFLFPVELGTKEQEQAALNTLKEVQFQRVAFAKMVEDLNGGYPDPNLSTEIDRYMAISAKAKDIMDDSETLEMSMKVKGGQGVISRVFGGGPEYRREQANQALTTTSVVRTDENE